MKKKLIFLVILFMILFTIVLEIPRFQAGLANQTGEKLGITQEVIR